MRSEAEPRLRRVEVISGLLASVLVIACDLPGVSTEDEPPGEASGSGETWFQAGELAIDLHYANKEMFEFETADYVEMGAPHLRRHTEVISHFAGEYRISPRLVLALMEEHSGALSNPEFDVTRPFGDLSQETGFVAQTRDVCARLRAADNPQAIMSELLPVSQLQELGGSYRRLFPGVESQRRPVQINVAAATPMQFPYPVGKTWFNGGTHSDSGSGSIMSSLDFMRPGEGNWGTNVREYVVSSAAGKVKRHSSCYVTVVHSGDWSTGYYHMDNLVVGTGDIVTANQPIGKYANTKSQALCDGGSSTGPHVHWTLMNDGREASLAGKVLSGWTVHPGSSNYDDNCNRMYFTRDGEKLCPWTPLINEGTDPSDPPDPGDLPRIELSKSTYSVGENIVVSYYDLPGNATDWLATYRSGTDNSAYIDWKYTNGAVDGTMTLDGLPAGSYEVRLFFNDSYNLESKVSFTVEEESDSCEGRCSPACPCDEGEGDCDSDADCMDGLYCDTSTNPDICRVAVSEPGIEMSKSTYQEGEDIVVNFTDLPGGAFDWIALFRSGTPHSTYLEWHYTNGATDGAMVFAGMSAGSYQARLFFNDSYNLEDQVAFTVETDVVNSCDGRCSASCPCDVGEGDCDNDAECKESLCEQLSGTDYCQVATNNDPRVELSKSTYSVNERIVVNFYNLPGNAWDWVATYRAGTANSAYIDWAYTDGAENGTKNLDGLPAGDYEVRLFFDDSYQLEYKVSFTVEAGPPEDVTVNCVVNPYAGVNWSTYGQHKANYHTHTTRSDGDHSPATVIDQYHNAGYSVLAITDHDTITWPWTDYGRDPDDLDMVAVRGDEYSGSDHVNAFYNFTRSSSSLEAGIPHIQSRGGLCQINHPGRYNSPSEWAWYVAWFTDYPACVGLEVINRDDWYPNDRRLWDNINEALFAAEGRFVWGFANDDKHETQDLYRGFQFMLLPNLSEAAVRNSQETGSFYFCSEPGGSGDARVPRFSAITVDNSAKQISIDVGDYETIMWVGPGTTTMGYGATFDFSDYEESFVRAVVVGNNGDCYSQPFGFEVVNN